jgi:hypothetical protein
MTLASASFITGVSVGFEFIQAIPEEDIDNSVILDLGIVRLIFTLNS